MGEVAWALGWYQTGTGCYCFETQVLPQMPTDTYPNRPDKVKASWLEGNFSVYDTPGEFNWCINNGKMRVYMPENLFDTAEKAREYFNGIFLAYKKAD